MIFELVSKGHEEPIDRVDMSNVGVQGAKTYFMGRKQLPEEEFDKIYEVKKIKKYQKPISYDWWKEETRNLDIDKEELK
jgi:hypothetical protein|tara:strand:- start:269 stop:505 length:237 start_codon:yes stop_codon:yes gene_type:complete